MVLEMVSPSVVFDRTVPPFGRAFAHSLRSSPAASTIYKLDLNRAILYRVVRFLRFGTKLGPGGYARLPSQGRVETLDISVAHLWA